MSHVELFLVYNKARPHRGQAEDMFYQKKAPKSVVVTYARDS